MQSSNNVHTESLTKRQARRLNNYGPRPTTPERFEELLAEQEVAAWLNEHQGIIR